MTDIDIDFANRNHALEELHHVPAVLTGQRRIHPSGVYFHDIPVDPLDGMAVWDYKIAADKGYFKVDFLNNSVYHGVRDEAHLMRLLTTPPPWKAFDYPDIVASLPHINKHFPVVQQIKPCSIADLAVCIALIRPGKRYLIGQSRATIDAELWTKTDEFYFKRSHAISYAATIVLRLNLMIEDVID